MKSLWKEEEVWLGKKNYSKQALLEQEKMSLILCDA